MGVLHSYPVTAVLLDSNGVEVQRLNISNYQQEVDAMIKGPVHIRVSIEGHVTDDLVMPKVEPDLGLALDRGMIVGMLRAFGGQIAFDKYDMKTVEGEGLVVTIRGDRMILALEKL